MPTLFGRALVPQTVFEELADPEAPTAVRAWIAQAIPWLDVRLDRDADGLDVSTGAKLDRGERAVIQLALSLTADLVLMDDRTGVAVARRRGLAATGTLGILDLAARRGLVDLVGACIRLRATNFYYRRGLLDALLAQHRRGNDE